MAGTRLAVASRWGKDAIGLGYHRSRLGVVARILRCRLRLAAAHCGRLRRGNNFVQHVRCIGMIFEMRHGQRRCDGASNGAS